MNFKNFFSNSRYEDYKIDEEIDKLSKNVVKLMIDKKEEISTAESITGGMIAEKITSVAGSSKVIKMALVAYSHEAKEKFLNVKSKSDYSIDAVTDMAKGIKEMSNADLTIAVSGYAGPATQDDELEVGTVFIAVFYKEKIIAREFLFYEENIEITRDKIRKMTTLKGLKMALELLEEV